ncbi:MAG: peroxide stress protein YaaA [Pseudomonadota bacterium]
MLVVLSPAKKLDETRHAGRPLTEPIFPEETRALTKKAKTLSKPALQKLMDISEPLAKLNQDRFRNFEDLLEGPAALMFDGDTYTGLDAKTLSEDGLTYAQNHLRILSGLYGLLRPLDAMRPYRLEMGSKLSTRRGKDLYAFWGDRIARALNAEAEATGSGWLLNCASQEYFGAVDRSALQIPVITPVFLEDRTGGPKTISFFAKQARGALARFVVENQLRDPTELTAWQAGGYRYEPDRSTPDSLVFLRPEQAQSAA